MALTKSQLKHFKHWMEDGNVIKNNDGTYSTQDAQFSNRLKDLNELKKYFKREFAVDEYADGGKLKNSKANVTNDMRGEDSDDYGTFEIYKNGGNIEVKVVNSDKQYNQKQYDWILGDKDKDSVANADDVKPLDKNIKERIDEPTITTGINNLISLKKSLDSTMYSFIEDLKNVAPNNSKIYARTKTPYSVLDKLIKKRLSTITDLIGTTIVTNDKKELDAVKNYVESGKIGKIVEMEDMYEKPKQGYRAYHFLIERNGMTIELQVKTKRQKALNELSHEPYKLGKLNSAVNLKMTELANRADEGDKNAIKEYNDFMNQPNVEKLFYADGGNKMAKGGGLGDLKVGSKLGLLNPRNGRYKYSTIEKIEGEDVFLVEKHPTRSQWDNHWKTTKSQIARFLNENNADFKSKKSYVLKMEDGGSMDSQQGIDLFEDYENIPANVQSVLDNHEDAFMDGDYKELQKALTQLKKIGYTFEFDLDGQAYDLRPIGTKGKSEMEEYEEGTEAFKQGGNVESSVTKLNKLGIRTSNEFGDEFRDFLDRLEENNDGEYIGYRLDLPNNELTLIQEKATKTVSILDYSQFPKNGSWRIEKHSIIHYKEGGSMTNKNQTTMTQEHIDKFVRGANSTDATAREISTRKLKEAGLDKNGKPLESKKAMTKSKSEPTPKYKVGDILNHKDNGENYKVKIEAVTGWTGDEHRYDVEFLDENLKPLNKFAKSYDDKLSKPKTEKKEKATNTSKAPMTDSKETEDEYCKRIIAEARARKLKAKKIAKKSANKPAVTKATERVERTHESIEKQIETGKLKKEQIEKIIAETEDLLRMLKKALKSL